jgi:hypothetical protein
MSGWTKAAICVVNDDKDEMAPQTQGRPNGILASVPNLQNKINREVASASSPGR